MSLCTGAAPLGGTISRTYFSVVPYRVPVSGPNRLSLDPRDTRNKSHRAWGAVQTPQKHLLRGQYREQEMGRRKLLAELPKLETKRNKTKFDFCHHCQQISHDYLLSLGVDFYCFGHETALLVKIVCSYRWCLCERPQRLTTKSVASPLRWACWQLLVDDLKKDKVIYEPVPGHTLMQSVVRVWTGRSMVIELEVRSKKGGLNLVTSIVCWFELIEHGLQVFSRCKQRRKKLYNKK